MAFYQTIGVGTAANDGTGDTIRAAFQKVNSNSALFAPIQHPGYPSGVYFPSLAVPDATGSAVAAGTARFTPWLCEASGTINALAVRPTTGGSSNIQLAVYASASTAAGWRPTGSQIGATGNIANASTSPISGSLTAAVTAGNLYFFGMNCNDSTMVCTAPSTSLTTVPYLMGSSTLANIAATVPAQGLSLTLTFGTWGDLTGQTFGEPTDAKHAMIYFKMA